MLTLGGKGYEKLYMGTGEQALADTDDNCIYFTEDDQGRYAYRVPVAALDLETDCAAWSTRKEKWYDRVLVFHSAGLPAGAVSPAPPGKLPADGRYLVDVAPVGRFGQGLGGVPGGGHGRGRKGHGRHRVEQPLLRVHAGGRDGLRAPLRRREFHL